MSSEQQQQQQQQNDADCSSPSICSYNIPFPYTSGPYPQQQALMETILEGIPQEGKTRILALESPTGTGKSLSLACASLYWLQRQEEVYYNIKMDIDVKDSVNKPSVSPTSTTTCTTTGIDWLDSWQPQHNVDHQRNIQKQKQQEKIRHDKLLQTLNQLRKITVSKDDDQNHTLERRENILRQALTKLQMEEKKRYRQTHKKRKRNTSTAPAVALKYQNDDDDEEENINGRQNRKQYIPGSVQWLLQPSQISTIPSSSTGPVQATVQPPPRIIYAARTHSQLSQFISEIRIVPNIGRQVRVVALASRSHGLCGQLRGRRLGSEQIWTESCLELRSKKGGCSYYKNDDAVATLALHSLTLPTDVEDMAALGKTSHTCSYYATRKALAQAQLIVMPYTVLCSPKTRKAILGGGGNTDEHELELLHSNTLVLIDEAHNLPQAIANLQSATLSLYNAKLAQRQLEMYLQRYVDKLSSHHLQLLGQIKMLLNGIIKSMTKSGYKDNGNNDFKTHNMTAGMTMNNNSVNRRRRQLMSSSQFLVSQRMETINLFPVLRYMQESKLSQKLLGFLPKPKSSDNAPSEQSKTKASVKASASSSLSTSHISPMSIVETFLEKLTFANDNDGQIVIDVSIEGNERLEFCVLNPAVHANDDLWTKPRAVCLVGGTLQPLDVMVQELIPTIASEAVHAQETWQKQTTMSSSTLNAYNKNALINVPKRPVYDIYKSDSFWAFTCGHVVDSSNVLLQALTKVDGVSIDVRHKTRSNPSVCEAIGKALIRLCQQVPHGVVVFLPSYKYEQILVDAWKSGNRPIWTELEQTTTVVREPKNASQVEKTLSWYSQNATKSHRGALLLSVVGGKLSEGINFANDLCRCVAVVGLPYADRSDPLLEEKLKLVANPQSYYRSLCLRAVNQSVGRAIRHAKDYAAIVVMDARYPQDDAIARGLPTWLTDSTPTWRKQPSDISSVLQRIGVFFEKIHKD